MINGRELNLNFDSKQLAKINRVVEIVIGHCSSMSDKRLDTFIKKEAFKAIQGHGKRIFEAELGIKVSLTDNEYWQDFDIFQAMTKLTMTKVLIGHQLGD